MPLYQDLYQALKERILDGTYSTGSMLPSEAKLKEDYGVSIITIRRAVHELELEGLVERHQGIGTFVKEQASDIAVIGMSTFTSDIAEGRLRLVRTLMEDGIVSASTAVAERLGLQAGSAIRRLVRLDCRSGTPLSIDEVFIPPSLAVHISRDIASSLFFLKEWQEALGIRFTHSKFEVTTRSPDESEQKALQINADIPVLITGELIFGSDDGSSVAWIESRYRSDRVSLSGTVTLNH